MRNNVDGSTMASSSGTRGLASPGHAVCYAWLSLVAQGDRVRKMGGMQMLHSRPRIVGL